MSWLAYIFLILLIVGVWLLVSFVTEKVKGHLKKSGVILSYGSIAPSCIRGLRLHLAQGPLQTLSVDSIAWRSLDRQQGPPADTGADSAASTAAAAAWLPITITGVTIVVSKPAAAGSKRRHKNSKGHGRHPAAAAAAWPAVSSVLAIARRLLPRVPITVQDVSLQLKDKGLVLQLRRAALQWRSDATTSTLWSTLLLHDVALLPGATAFADSFQVQPGCTCPVAQISAGLAASRGPVPVSCTELRVQVGLLKMSGLSQLLLLAAAAVKPRWPAPAPARRAVGVAEGVAAEKPGKQPGAGSKLPPARMVLKALTWMPEKVKVSIAGAQVLPCQAVPAERCGIMKLPVVLGSLGAISVAASACQRRAAAKPGGKLVSLTASVGQLELSAGGQQTSEVNSSSSTNTSTAATHSGTSRSPNQAAAAVFTFPGVAGNVSLTKSPAADLEQQSSRTSSGHGTGDIGGREGLRRRHQAMSEQGQQQAQQHLPTPHLQQHQQWVLKAACNGKLSQQVRLQLQADQLPALVKAVHVLQASLRDLQARQQASLIAAAAVAAADAAARESEESVPDDQLPENTLSPAASLSSVLRPDTPSLSTPRLSPSPGPAASSPEAPTAAVPAAASASNLSAAMDGKAVAAPAVAAEDAAGFRGLATLGTGMLQRLPSKLLFGNAAAGADDAHLGMIAEVSIAAEAGLAVEVASSRSDPLCLLRVAELEAGASAEWLPGNSSSSGQPHEQELRQAGNAGAQLSMHAMLQQLSVSVASEEKQPAPSGVVPTVLLSTALHKLVLLDSSSVQLVSSTAEDSKQQPELEPTALPAKPPLQLQLSALAGQLQVAASVAALQPVLGLAEQLYMPTPRHVSLSGTAVPAGASSLAAGTGNLQASAFEAAAAAPIKVKKHKTKPFLLTAVDVQLQACEVTFSHQLCVTSPFVTEAAKEAAAAGMQTQLLLSLSGVQLSYLPVQQQLGASLQLVQVGYNTQCPPSSTVKCQQQSVELLLLQAVHLRQYRSHGLQLLKLAAQQLRSDNHIDVVLAAAMVAEALLQQGLSTVQQMQVKAASWSAVSASCQAAVAAVVAAATEGPDAAQEADSIAQAAAAELDDQVLARGDSFSALAVQPILTSLGISDSGGRQLPSASAGSATVALPPAAIRPGSGSGGSRTAARLQKHKPVLALEARICDVAVQLSVCDNDALMVQMEQLNYSSVLEQAVISKLRFAINDRSIVQVPHAAVHQVPGWLPPGVTAAAAAAGGHGPPAVDVGGSSHTGQQQEARSCSGADAAGQQAGASQAQQQQQQQQQGIGVSASWQDLRSAEGGAMAGLGFLDVSAPCSSLGSRRPLPEVDQALYQRQSARQQAGRQRCKVPASQASSTQAAGEGDAQGGSATAPGGRSSISFSRSNDAAKAAGAAGGTSAPAGGAVISLDVYAEKVLFSIPHDEAPGRIIIVTETWAKAVKEVLKPRLTSIKGAVGALKAGMTTLKGSSGSGSSSTLVSRPVKVKPPKPAYLELMVNLQQIVFSLEQHPLETWFGLHGPLMQSVAAERHLTEQLLASCASAHGRISRSGLKGATDKEGVVGGRGDGRQAQRLASGRKQAKQWQSRRWGALSKKGVNPGLAGVAAGSVTEGAAAAAVEGPHEPQATPGAGSGHQQAPADTAGPSTPAATAPAPRSDSGGNAGAVSGGLSDPEAAAGEVSADETSDDTDSSDVEAAVQLADPDALAAALPSSAQELAAAAAGQGNNAGLAGKGLQPGGTAAANAPAAAAGVVPTDAAAAAALLSAAAASGEGSNENTEMAQAVLEAHRELFAMYKYRCRPLEAAAEDQYHQCRAVMHVRCLKAEAVVLVCLPGNPAADVMATEVIRRVDPPSEGVEMSRTQSISLDVSAHEVVAHFGGVEEMASTIGSVQASGLLVRARQVCAPPQTRPMRMAVGRWHAADVPMVVKGTRPPMKMYTDIKAELEDVQGAFCPGLEAPFGQLNIAFKRLVTPNALNPDGSVPPSVHPGLPWWDMMRYMWRGVASVKVRNLTAVVANTLNPHVRPRDERLALTAATLSVSVAAGRIDMTTTNITAHAHALPPDSSLGDALLVLPAFHLPLANITFNIMAKLPGGRSSLFHHVFPILTAVPGPGSTPQELVDVFSIMKCEGWSLGIDIAVSSDKTFAHGRAGAAPGGVTGSSGPATVSAAGVPLGGPLGAAGSCWHYYQPYSLPHAFIGEFQIKYIIDMVDSFVNAHPIVRYCRKLKPYYVRDRRPEAAAAARAVAAVRASILQMPLLKQRIEINLTADVFRVHHDAQDADDPSDLVYIALSSVRYSNTFTYSRYKRTLQLSNGSRLKDSMRQFMASLSVEAYDLNIIKPQADEQLSSMLSSSQWGFGPGCYSPAGQAWGSELQQAGQAGVSSLKKGGLPQDPAIKQHVEPRTPSRSAVSVSAAAASTATPGSPRSMSATTNRSPLVHGRTATGPGAAGRRMDAAAAAGVSGPEDCDTPGFGQGLIATAACFLLRQAPADAAYAAAAAALAPGIAGQIPIDPPPVPKRPIRMIAQDVKLLCPAELRDTCMLLFHHMQKAFSGISFGQPKGPVRISTKQQQAAAESSSGSNSPKISRSRSDGGEGSGNLSRSSYGGIRQHASSDGIEAADGAAAASTSGSGADTSMVNSPADEDRMLQLILSQNAAAAAAAAAAERKRAAARSRELQARSGSAGGVSGGGMSAAMATDSFVSSIDSSIGVAPGVMPSGQDGQGHAAAAVRALRGGVGGGSSGALGRGGSGLDEDVLHESPHSAAMSDLSSHLSQATDSSAAAGGPVTAAGQVQQPPGSGISSGGGLVEQLLLEYEIEFVQVQVNLVSDSARGSLVLGTNSALLLGHLNTARLERSVSFKMDQVQAHVVCSEMDPLHGPLWLQIANGKLSTPPGAEAIMRQVLLPFKCQLVTTKQAQSATAAALNAAAAAATPGPGSVGPASATGSSQNLQQQQQQLATQRLPQQQAAAIGGGSSNNGEAQAGVPAGNAAQELRLHVPTIGARLDSRQFEVLMDVIQNIAMAPIPTFPPSVKGMWQHPDGISEDDDNQDVQYALETLQSLRERQRCLEQELLAVLAAQQQYAAWQQRNMSQHSLAGLHQQQQVVLPGVAASSGLRLPGAGGQHQPYSVTSYTANMWEDTATSASADSEYASTHTPSSAPSGAWGAEQKARMPPSYADIKEASITLVLALAAAGTAAERQQLVAAATGTQQQRQLLKGAHAAASSSVGNLSTVSASTAAPAGRGLLVSTPASSYSNLAALQQQEQLVLVAERPTLVWWAQEQLQGALDAITASRTVLELLRGEAGLLKVRQRNAMGVDITVDTIDWALSKGSTVIVQGDLQGISYQSIRSEDHTGTTKIQLHTATFRDPQQQQQAAAVAATAAAAAAANKANSAPSAFEHAAAASGGVRASSPEAASTSGSLPPLVQCSTPRELSASATAALSHQQALDAAAAAAAAAAAEAGLILAPWNPDESWEADELVRIYAIHGAMEARHVVYEHIEVLVHPIRVHLTAALAGALQDYFNLREEEGSKDKDSKPISKLQEAAAARVAKQAAREEKRRLTAPGDLPSGPSATGPSSSGPSAVSPVGPLTAAAHRRPSIFHRRAATAAAAAAAAAAASSGMTGPQPLIAVPSSEYDAAGIVHSTDAGQRSVASTPTLDSPALEHYGLPPPALAVAGAAAGGPVTDSAGVSTPAAAATTGAEVQDATACSRSLADDGASLYSLALSGTTGGDAALAPVLLSQGTVCEWSVVLPAEALGLRYGTVKRNRLGRVGISIPYPGAGIATGTVAGASAGGMVPGGAVAAAQGQAAATPGGQSAAGSNSRNRALPVRSIKFKHVRFNRMHARLTYESPALSIRNFGLVLDNRVYRNIDGGWRTVLNRYKWDVVRSLLKSVTGLQARKLQELQIPTYGAEPPDTLELRSSAGFKAGIMSLLKGRKGLGAKLRLGSTAAGEGNFSDELEGLAAGSTAGELGGDEGAVVGDVEGTGAGAAGADYLELMRSALRVKHKQRKVQLLLGAVPPLPPPQSNAAVALG